MFENIDNRVYINRNKSNYERGIIMKYKGYEIELSDTTTDTWISVFGSMKRVIKRVYSIDGQTAGKFGINTSIRECKEAINKYLSH